MAGRLSGRPEAVVDDERDGEVGPAQSSAGRANKAVTTAAELGERRGGTKENADLQSTVRTQSREAVSQAQARIREAVTRNRQGKLTALLHHINIDVLRASFFGLKKSAAPGVDEMTWTEYAETLEANLVDLHASAAVAEEIHLKGGRQTATARHLDVAFTMHLMQFGFGNLCEKTWQPIPAARDPVCR